MQNHIKPIKNMASIFSRIIAGEIPSYKVAEDDNYYAFLDIISTSSIASESLSPVASSSFRNL